jgi:hypothetical protein
VGCTVASAFSLWLAVGTFILKPHRQLLPTSVDRCNVTQAAMWNQSMWNDSSVADVWLDLNSTSYSDQTTLTNALQINSTSSSYQHA